MKKISLFLLSLLSIGTAYPQDIKVSTEFGIINSEELALERYPADTTAEAVYLYDYGDSYFVLDNYEGFNLYFKHRFKIKVLNKAGFDYANIEIPLYKDGNSMEDILELKGYTYSVSANGVMNKTPLNPSQVYTENRSPKLNVKKFAMPDIREGSVFEVEYTVKSPFMINLQDWEFQKTIPVIYSEYRTRMIPFFTYTFVLNGASKFSEQKSFESTYSSTLAGVTYRDMIYVFVMKDLPAFRNEPFISCPRDYLIKMDFQLMEVIKPEGSKISYMTTWSKFCGDMMKQYDLGVYMKNAQKGSKELVNNLVGAIPSSLEKAETIYNYVIAHTKWNRRNNKFSNVSFKDFSKSMAGNSAEINLYLAGLLRAAGLTACPVLISTRNNGKIRVDYPMHQYFNYVVVAVTIDGKRILLDATEPYIGFGRIPARCLNESGFQIVDNKTYEWIKMEEKSISKETYFLDWKWDDPSDSLICSVHISADGFEGMKLREKLLNEAVEYENSLQKYEFYLKDSLKIKNLGNPLRPLSVGFLAKTPNVKNEGFLRLKPFAVFAGFGDPFRKSARQFPIDMEYCKGKTVTAMIHIPEGYEIAREPILKNLDDDNIRIVCKQSKPDDNTLILEAEYVFKKDLYDAKIYGSMKDYFLAIDQVFGQTLILAKKVEKQATIPVVQDQKKEILTGVPASKKSGPSVRH